MIILGTIPSWYLAFHVCVAGCSGNGSEECPYLRVHKTNSPNLARATKMQDSRLMNSWDSFPVTPPSVSSETRVIYSSLILGMSVFRDWPFLGSYFCVYLGTAANFRLFLYVAIFLKEKRSSVVKTELSFLFFTNSRAQRNVTFFDEQLGFNY